MSVELLFAEAHKILESLVSSKFITAEHLADYQKTIESNLHAKVVSTFVHAGWKIGWIPAIEAKWQLAPPFKFREHKKRKPDITFFDKNRQPLGMLEYQTLDEAHFLDKVNILERIAKQAKTDGLKPFCFVMVTLPENVIRPPPWPESRKIFNCYREFHENWYGKVITDLGELTKSYLCTIKEDGLLLEGRTIKKAMPIDFIANPEENVDSLQKDDFRVTP